jgi:hypothetical protein
VLKKIKGCNGIKGIFLFLKCLEYVSRNDLHEMTLGLGEANGTFVEVYSKGKPPTLLSHL